MNDFTKEELNIIYEFLDYNWDDYDEKEDIFNFKDKIANIRQKLQSMIEDYIEPENCPHHWLTDPKLRFMSNPPKYNLLCSRCGITRYMDCAEFDRLNQWGVGQ